MRKETAKNIKSRRSKGEGNIMQRKDGKWTARLFVGYKADGKANIKAFYGNSRREVAFKLDEYKALHRKGESETNSSYFETYILYLILISWEWQNIRGVGFYSIKNES